MTKWCETVVERGLEIHAVSLNTWAEVEERAEGLRPIALFLDIDLGGERSLPRLPTLKALFPGVPIIVITSAKDVTLLAEALAKGADDFIRKPLHPVEIQARLEARLAVSRELKEFIHRKFLDVDLNRRDDVVCGPAACTHLSSRESKLLGLLIDARGTCVSRERLESVAWGALSVSRNSLDKRIQAIRTVLKEIGSSVTISAKYGVGYKLHSAPDSQPTHDPG